MAKIALSISLIKENVTLLENILKDVETPSCLIEDVGTLYFKDSHNNDAYRIKTFFWRYVACGGWRGRTQADSLIRKGSINSGLK